MFENACEKAPDGLCPISLGPSLRPAPKVQPLQSGSAVRIPCGSPLRGGMVLASRHPRLAFLLRKGGGSSDPSVCSHSVLYLFRKRRFVIWVSKPLEIFGAPGVEAMAEREWRSRSASPPWLCAAVILSRRSPLPLSLGGRPGFLLIPRHGAE